MTIRWKPSSEGDGNLVVLTNEPFVVIDGDGSPIRGTSDPRAARANGYRYAIRYPAPGSAFNGAVVRTRSGAYAVPDPGRDWGGGKGPELPPARSVPSGGSRQYSPAAEAFRRRVAAVPPAERRAFVERELERNPSLPSQLGIAGAVGAGAYQTRRTFDPVQAARGINTVRKGIGWAKDLMPSQGPNIPSDSILGSNLRAGVGRMVGPASGGYAGGAGQVAQAGGAWGQGAGAGTVAGGQTAAGAGMSKLAAGANAIAPWMIAALVAKGMYRNLTAPSQKEAFPGLFKEGMSLNAPPPSGGFAMPGNSFLPKQPEIRSFAPVARQAGYEAAQAGRSTLPEYASGRPPATAKSGSMYTTGGKPYVLITKDDPIVKALANTPNPVPLNPAGRLGVNPNQYGNYAAAAYTTTEKYLGNERGGK